MMVLRPAAIAEGRGRATDREVSRLGRMLLAGEDMSLQPAGRHVYQFPEIYGLGGVPESIW